MKPDTGAGGCAFCKEKGGLFAYDIRYKDGQDWLVAACKLCMDTIVYNRPSANRTIVAATPYTHVPDAKT